MRRFTELYMALDATTRTNDKVAAIRRYFEAAAPADAAWAVYFLSGRRPKRLLSAALLGIWAAVEARIPAWLLSESYSAVGDAAETATLLLPPGRAVSDRPLHEWVEDVVLRLRDLDEEGQRAAVLAAWSELDEAGRFVFNKLITGELRVGVSQRLLTRALADVSGVDPAVVAGRLMGLWEPTPEFYGGLVAAEAGADDLSRPYPFFLAHPLPGPPEALGDVAAWQAEWKWDGIRSQLIHRGGRTFLWSRGEELVTERYPEIAAAAERLPDGTVIDGEIMPWQNGGPLPFAELQRRIGRKSLSKRELHEVPVVLVAYDLLEWGGLDWRGRPLRARRAQLEELLDQIADERLLLSQVVAAPSWEALAQGRERSRELNVEGLMLKRLDSTYGVGRVTGDWWKWKIEPHSVDAVLIYAQRGSGRRASLYTDYTFALWNEEGELVPFAKAYSGLTDAEIREVDRFVRGHTQERFGPVRSVTPELVFEIAFENIQLSNRHKSGIAVRFPRILRWRRDKRIEDADSLAALRALLPQQSLSNLSGPSS